MEINGEMAGLEGLGTELAAGRLMLSRGRAEGRIALAGGCGGDAEFF
jgi:hypothetical protein